MNLLDLVCYWLIKANTIPEQSETFDLSLVSSSFKGENNLIYLDGQSLLFSTPIYDEKGIYKVTLLVIVIKENNSKI